MSANPTITIETSAGSVVTDLDTLRRATRSRRGGGETSDPRQTEAFAPDETGPDAATRNAVAADELKAFVERIERLEEEKKTITDDIGDVYAEAKSRGFDVSTMRKVVALRRQDASTREEAEALLDLYMQALGMGYGRREG